MAHALDEFSKGYLAGILAGEGHFGGDGRQAQVTLRMHTRHERLFRWLVTTFPESKLYGPYHHGGRDYFQWMARGRFLREELIPILLPYLGFLDDHVRGRLTSMCENYGIPMGTGLPVSERELD